MTSREYFALLETLNYHIENLIEIADKFKFDFAVFNQAVKNLKTEINEINDIEKIKEIFINFNNQFKIVENDFFDLSTDKDVLINEMFLKTQDRLKLYTSNYESLRYHIFDYKCIVNCFDRKNVQIFFPIESKEKMELIYVVVSNNFDCDSHIRIMDYIEKLNNEALELKSKRFYSLDVISKKKKEALKKIKIQIEDLKQQIFVSDDYVLDDEKKALALKAQNLLQKNQDLRKSGYTEDVLIGFNLLIESDVVDFNLDSDPKVNMLIALRFIEHYISLINLKPSDELFLKLNKAINAYDEFNLVIINNEKEQKLINKLDEDNKEQLEFASSIINELSEFSSEDINLLNYIDSIYSNEKIDEKQKQKYISDIISNQKSKIDFKKYRTYKMMQQIQECYINYNDYDNYDSKVYMMSYLIKLLDEYQEFIKTPTLQDDDELVEFELNKESDNNNILFLPIDGICGIEKYILYEDKKHSNDYSISDMNSIMHMIKMLKDSDILTLQGNSKSVKNKYIEKSIWRLSKGRDRLIYMPIISGGLGLPVSKPCILVVTAGIKYGDFDIYKYVDSNQVVSALSNFFEEIRLKCASIRNSNKSYEEKNRELNQVRNDLISQSNSLFKQMNENLKAYISNGHRLDEIKTKK